MQRAGVPGFHDSPSHFDYVRAARKDAASPYRSVAPTSAEVQAGDLLCFVRSKALYGYDGLVKRIDAGDGGLPMHCDIIAPIDAGKVCHWRQCSAGGDAAHSARGCPRPVERAVDAQRR